MIFELPLAEEKVKPHQVTALHLMTALAFTGSGALFYLFYPPAKSWSIALFIAGLAILFTAIFRNKWIVRPGVNRILRFLELAVLLALCGFTYFKHWTPPAVMFGVLSAAVLFAIFWEQSANAAQFVIIDTAGIKLPLASRRRFIDWTDIDQVLFKYGTLTVNCSDNRLYQWTIGNTNFDKEAFEGFCNNQVEAGKAKRDKNNW